MDGTAKKGFCMFFDWMDAFDYLDPVDFKRLVYKINNYYLYGDDIEEALQDEVKDEVSLIALGAIIMQQIRRAEEKAEAGARGAEKKKEKQLQEDS